MGSLTRRMLLALALAALAVGATGCSAVLSLLPGRGKAKEPPAKNALGLNDDRFTELDEAGLDTEMARPKNGLRLTIRTDKTQYQIGEPIIADIRIENVSVAQSGHTARDIPIYFEPVARARDGGAVEWLFRFQIRDDANLRLVYQSPDVKVPDAERASYYHYVVLPAQSFVGRRFIFWPSRARGLMNPGRYSLVANYSVDEDSTFVIVSRHLSAEQVELLGPKLAYVRVWTGQVFSNRVTFDVKRKKLLGIF